MKPLNTRWLYIIPALAFTPIALADYKADIGYTALQNLLGANTPKGTSVKVTQVEAGGTIYAPDVTDPQFNGKTISFPGAASASPSGHATWVGSIFYGTSSMASGISGVTSYEANNWLNSLFFALASPPANGSRIANDSWVGNANTAADNGSILRLVDRQTQLYELVQVVGMANSPSVNPLLSSAYNVIAVGRSAGNLDYGSEAIDSVYVAGRTRPDVVSPETTTSASTPEVAATAALLVETGHSGGLTLSKSSSTITGVGTVFNAERAETIKAALMAGADRVSANISTTDNITDYGSIGHLTANGLDDRFGAGQVNVLHSYQIIASGEQNSLEDGGANAGAISLNGFDYDNAFGGTLSSNKTATYKFYASYDSKLSASLIWNISVANNAALSTSLPNLNLELFDVTTQTTSAFSSSTLNNTENIWVNLVTGHNYELRVKSGVATNFSWDYALAWHIALPLNATEKLPQTLTPITLSPAKLSVRKTATASTTSNAGLAVTYSTSTPTICSVSGAVVTGKAVGACIILANQAGNLTYNAATQQTQTIAVTKGAQTITFAANPVSIKIGLSSNVSATSSSGLIVGLSTTSTTCKIVGSVVTGLKAGVCAISGKQAGNVNYLAAPNVTKNITITP